MFSQHMLADFSRIIFFKIKLRYINYAKIIYAIFWWKLCDLFYNDNFSIFFVILSDFDNLKLDKIKLAGITRCLLLLDLYWVLLIYTENANGMPFWGG